MRLSFKKISVAILLIYAIFGFIILPYILKPKIIEIVSKELHAKLNMDSIHINPFLFKVYINGVVLSDLEEKEIASFGSLFVDLELYSLFRGAVHFREITLSEPKFTLAKNSDNTLNILNILKEKEPQLVEEKSSDTTQMPRIILDKLHIRNGEFLFLDATLSEPFVFKSLNIGLSLKDVDTDYENEDAAAFDLYAGFDDGGYVSIKSELYELHDPRAVGSFEFEASRLFSKYKYIRDMVNFEVADGKISLKSEYFFSLSDLNATHLKNFSLALKSVRIKPKERAGDLFSIKSFLVQNATLYPFAQTLEIEKVALDGSKLLFKRDKNGVLDWSRYLSMVESVSEGSSSTLEQNQESNATAKWSATLGALELKGVSLELEDALSSPALKASLQEISVVSDSIEFAQNAEGVEVAFGDANLSLSELLVAQQHSSEEILKFKELLVSGIALRSKEHSLSAKQTTLESFEIELQKEQDGTLNIQKIVDSQKKATKTPQKNENEEEFVLRLEEFLLKDSSVAFEDMSLQKSMRNELKNINARLLNISTKSDEPLEYELLAQLLSGGDLHARGRLYHSPLRESGVFRLSDIALDGLNPYLEEYTHATFADGRISVDGKTNIKQKRESLDLGVAGAFVAESLSLEDVRDKKELFALHKLQTHSYDFRLSPMRLLVGDIDIYSLYLGANIDANATLNLSQILKSSKEKTKEQQSEKSESKESGFAYKIERINLHQWRLKFDDASIKPSVHTDIHDIEGSLYPLSHDPKERTHVEVAGVINEFASLKVTGEVESANPAHYTDLDIVAKNINLGALSGYSAAFTGYEIDKGSLDLDLGYDISEGILLGKNRVLIEEIALGAVSKEEGVTVLPMRLALGLLRDSRGAVSLNLPVKGDMNTPDFAYGGLILKAFTNLMGRAVTSPFRFLSEAMGLNAEGIEYIAFASGSAEIAPPEREKVAEIAKIMQAKPDIIIDIAGSFERVKDTEALGMQKCIDIMSEKEQKKALIAECIKTQTVEESELLSLANTRAEKLYEYMVDVAGIDASRIVKKESKEEKSSKEEYVKLQLEIELQ